MTTKVAAVAAGFTLIAMAIAGCAEVSRAGEEVSGTIDRATMCADAVSLASFDIGSVTPSEIGTTADKKAKEARDLVTKIDDQSLRAQVEDLATQYEQLGQQDGHGIANVGTFVQRNVDKLNTIKNLCL